MLLTVAADDLLAIVKRELSRSTTAQLSVELNFGSLVCIKRDVLNLHIRCVVPNADPSDLLILRDFQCALKLLVLAHHAELLRRERSVGIILIQEVQLDRANAIIDTTGDAAQHA